MNQALLCVAPMRDTWGGLPSMLTPDLMRCGALPGISCAIPATGQPLLVWSERL